MRMRSSTLYSGSRSHGLGARLPAQRCTRLSFQRVILVFRHSNIANRDQSNTHCQICNDLQLMHTNKAPTSCNTFSANLCLPRFLLYRVYFTLWRLFTFCFHYTLKLTPRVLHFSVFIECVITLCKASSVYLKVGIKVLSNPIAIYNSPYIILFKRF